VALADKASVLQMEPYNSVRLDTPPRLIHFNIV
jgi:hypothetical protein